MTIQYNIHIYICFTHLLAHIQLTRVCTYAARSTHAASIVHMHVRMWLCSRSMHEPMALQRVVFATTLAGSVFLAHASEQPASLAGKHVVGMEGFRASSQDGQYQPWDRESETMVLPGAAPAVKNPSPAPALRVTPTRSVSFKPGPQKSVAPTVREPVPGPVPEASATRVEESKKGLKRKEPESPESAAGLYLAGSQCLNPRSI